MSKTCLNCSQSIPDNGDFCESCESELNEVIDANDVYMSTDLVNVKSDPFFQSKTITGDFIEGDDELIAQQIRSDTVGGTGYVMGIFVIIVIMVIFVLISN